MSDINQDAVAARKRALALALANGEDTRVMPSGELELEKDLLDSDTPGIQVPTGKLA